MRVQEFANRIMEQCENTSSMIGQLMNIVDEHTRMITALTYENRMLKYEIELLKRDLEPVS